MIVAESKSKPGLFKTDSPFLHTNEKGSFFSPSTGKSGLFSPGTIQPKLEIGSPDDEYEKEADRVADTVMRMPEPNGAKVQRKCKECEEEDKKKLQRKGVNNSTVHGDSSIGSYIGSLNGRGQSLSPEERNFFEPRFGYDLSSVKIHTDSDATASAQSLNALAYTVGNHVVFNTGQYAPQTDSGKKLLAHELAHTIQQAPGSQGGTVALMPDNENDVREGEAKRAANEVIFGTRPLTSRASIETVIQRQTKQPEVEMSGAYNIETSTGSLIAGKNPDFPLPEVPDLRISTRFAEERAAHYRYFPVHNDPYHPDDVTNGGNPMDASIYENQAFTIPRINDDYAAFRPLGSLAADALADHLRLQHSLGFAVSKDIVKSLTSGQKERASEELTIKQSEIMHTLTQLDSNLHAVIADQSDITGAAHAISAYMAGKAMDITKERLATTEKDERRIEIKIQHAGEIARKTQDIILLAASVVTLKPEAVGELNLHETVKGTAELAETGAKVLAEPGLVGSLVEDLVQVKNQAQLDKLKNEIANLDNLITREAIYIKVEKGKSVQDMLKGAVGHLQAHIESAADYARQLRDVMRSPLKLPTHRERARGMTPAAAAAAADAKDPAKRAEILTTSAMATSTLLDGAIESGNSVLNEVQKFWLGLQTSRPKYDIAEDPSYPLGTLEPHGTDMDETIHMMNFIAGWLFVARGWNQVVKSEADQFKSPMQ